MKIPRFSSAMLFGLGATILPVPVALLSKPVANAMLLGFRFLERRWGGLHDPVQLLYALLLNIAVYTVIGYVVLTIFYSLPRNDDANPTGASTRSRRPPAR